MTDLLYSDVEEALRDSVRSTLDRFIDDDVVSKIYDDPDTDTSPLWRALSDQVGLAGLLIPEELGGSGAGPRDAATVLEELGRTAAPVPFLTSAVIATTCLLRVGDREILPELAEGRATAALLVPWTARRGAWPTGQSVIEPVAGALEADYFLLPVGSGDGAVSLNLLRRGDVEITRLTSLDMSRPLARVAVRAEGRPLASGDAAVEAVDTALAAGTALLASEQVGLARECLQRTVEYTRTRVQFARPIGSFQAIKHRLADLYLQVVQAQAAARHAAASLAEDDDEGRIAQAVAGSWCSDVAVRAAEEALQLHGGIAMTWEHWVHTRLKRAKSDQLALGTPDAHWTDLASLVDLTA